MARMTLRKTGRNVMSKITYTTVSTVQRGESLEVSLRMGNYMIGILYILKVDSAAIFRRIKEIKSRVVRRYNDSRREVNRLLI